MTKRSISAGWTGALLMCALVTRQPVAAQSGPQGWPDSGGPKKAAPSASPAPKKARSPASKPEQPKSPEAKQPKPPETTSPITTESVEATTPAETPTRTGGDDISAAFLLALQQQANLLGRLALELRAQRALMMEQQQKLELLYARDAAAAAGSTVAAPATVAADAAPIAAGTGGVAGAGGPEAGTTGLTAPAQAADADLLTRIRRQLLSTGRSTP